MQRILSLPKYPITEMYEPWKKSFQEDRGLLDQELLFCQGCSHAKLGVIVPPAKLYGASYRTRTKASEGASRALYWFADFIDKQSDEDAYDIVIDIGANDGSLLSYFEDKALVAVDPNASVSSAVTVIREFVESADLVTFSGSRKLIVSSHTLEHVEEPAAFISKAASVMRKGDYLALQFPSLERLVHHARIDHIHHQHIHYFSERSITRLLAAHGLKVVAVEFSDWHYGALMVMARKGRGEVAGEEITDADLMCACQSFEDEIKAVRVPNGAIAYGASLMLPVLSYWLDLSGIEFIADNDKSKRGMRYINFNKRIETDFNLRYRDVVITGVASKIAARALVADAFEQGANNVVVPLHTL